MTLFQKAPHIVLFVVLMAFVGSAEASYYCARVLKKNPKVAAVTTELLDQQGTKSTSSGPVTSLQSLALEEGYAGYKKNTSTWRSVLNFFRGSETVARESLEIRLGRKLTSRKVKAALTQPHINLSSLDLTDDELFVLTSLMNKQTVGLDLSNNPRLTNKGIAKALMGSVTAQVLDLTGTQAKLKGKLLDILNLKFSETLRELSIDNLRRGDLKKLKRFKDLRRVDLHRSYSIKRRMFFSLSPAISASEVIDFVNNKPKNFYEIVLPGLSVEHMEYINSKVKMESKRVKIRTKYAFENLPVKNWVRVRDGDNIVVNLPGESAMFGQLSLRIYGVDTGELGTISGSAEDKMAIAAANFVELYRRRAQKVHITHGEKGKYAGRMLAEVWIELRGEKHPVNLADELIRHGLGLPYYGEAKAAATDSRVWQRLYDANKAFVNDLIYIKKGGVQLFEDLGGVVEARKSKK